MSDKIYRPKITKVINPNITNKEVFSIGLFWDYENVPLSPDTGESFIFAIKNLSTHVNLIFSNVIVRKNYTKPEIIERLRETGLFSIILNNLNNLNNHSG